MIFDKIENIDNYPQIPQNAVDFIKNITSDIVTGRHDINENIYANVDEYTTKPPAKCRLEAHKKYIDIQLILQGQEELDYTSIQGLEISEEYDDIRDVMFFQSPQQRLNSVILEKGYFILLYPHEAHQPQMNYPTSMPVKKVVVKIKCA